MRSIIPLTILLTSPAFAEKTASASDIMVGKGAQSFIALFYMVSFICGAALLLSIVSTFADYEKFKQRAENPSRQLIIRALIAGILMNPSTSVMILSETLGFQVNKSNHFCFAYQLNAVKSGDVIKQDGTTRECYNTATNNLQSSLKAKYDTLNATELASFLTGKFKIVVTIFQVIAMYFYLSAWFKIYSISEGKERQTTYGKQVIVLLFSTVFLNLPTAMDAGYKWLNSINTTS